LSAISPAPGQMQPVDSFPRRPSRGICTGACISESIAQWECIPLPSGRVLYRHLISPQFRSYVGSSIFRLSATGVGLPESCFCTVYARPGRLKTNPPEGCMSRSSSFTQMGPSARHPRIADMPRVQESFPPQGGSIPANPLQNSCPWWSLLQSPAIIAASTRNPLPGFVHGRASDPRGILFVPGLQRGIDGSFAIICDAQSGRGTRWFMGSVCTGILMLANRSMMGDP
jgi:hypothetical protein